MGTPVIYRTVFETVRRRTAGMTLETYLDIGAGRGELIRKFRETFKVRTSVCDYTGELIRVENQKVDIADLNRDPLPYSDNAFDVVTCTEVIEHLEHYRETLREIGRVLKPGGICVLTTPNILNLNSRFRFLWFGFWNLFGPLPIKHSAKYSTGGHINPVSYFYVAHSLIDAGFEGIELDIDKYQRSSIPKLIVAWPLIQLFGAWAFGKEVRRFQTIDEANAPLVKQMNSVPMLLGRTIIVSARKPPTPSGKPDPATE